MSGKIMITATSSGGGNKDIALITVNGKAVKM